ncbi:c-type cytochrome, partial [Synechococcus moorigangaii CMS01]|nr:c-type cytochrome [Synechococcus moorigangaii CMS01]
MKRLTVSQRNWFLFSVFFLFALFANTATAAIEGDASNGRKLFKAQCAACHKLDKKLVGPALTGVTERRDYEWLVQWIQNNAALRESGDAEANAIFNEFNGSPMPAFPALSEGDIKDILAYTEQGDPKPAGETTAGTGGGGTAAPAEDKGDMPLLIGLGVLFILMIALLIKVKNTLKAVKGEEPTSLITDFSSFTRLLVKNRFIMTVFTIVIAVWFLNVLYWTLMGVGVTGGADMENAYQPEQPIAFSHKLHAGDNQIDCNYCHSSARHSKTSGIPSANVCMNCHMYVDGSEIVDAATGELKYGGDRSPEIQKIYAAIGWDPEKRIYIEDYEKKPIKWIRIHNLPDLAYFNHSQHVTAGNIECQTCHGPVQEMEEVYQHAELTMGWCINCHRETEVDMKNGFYQDISEELMAKYHDEKITASKVG